MIKQSDNLFYDLVALVLWIAWGCIKGLAIGFGLLAAFPVMLIYYMVTGK